MNEDAVKNDADNIGAAGSDNTEHSGEPAPEAGGAAGEVEAPSGGAETDTTGVDSKASGSGDTGVSNAGVNEISERTSTGTAGSRTGADTKNTGYKATGGSGDTGSGQDVGHDRRAEATKVSPTDESEEYRSVATGEEQQQSVQDEPKFRGPKPFRRWKRRAYNRAQESAKRT